MRFLRSRPSPAMIVALLGLFVALGGAGMAATGGNFILGQSNSAGSKTSLTAGANDRALAITNLNTGASATALGLNVAKNRPPLIVNSSTNVANLNADLLDGYDAGAFTQGGGHVYSAHVDFVPFNSSGKLLTLPGIGTFTYDCSIETIGFSGPSPVTITYQTNLDSWYVYTDNFSWPLGEVGSFHAMASRSAPGVLGTKALADIHIANAERVKDQWCTFQAVATVFLSGATP